MTTPARKSLPNVLLIGTGEYTTGLVAGQPSNSDKAAGIIFLTVAHLRQRGIVGPVIGLCGTNGTKLPMIRRHLQERITQRYAIDTQCLTFPADSESYDPLAYVKALDSFERGDVAIVTTPDQTHYEIARACIIKGLHVLIAKPIVQTLEDHHQLQALAAEHSVLCGGELHKRWDPLYSDASNRIAANKLGAFTYYSAFMSQPKSQLSTFSSWIQDGTTDISYYLNSHHVDFLCHAVTCGTIQARPTRVYAAASSGFANQYLDKNHPFTSTKFKRHDVDDSITLTVTFVDQHHNTGVAVFTSCWTGPLRPDAHTQQTQHFVGHLGEIHIDQAHRGYKSTTDEFGVMSHNPLFFSYTPDAQGRFAGAGCYGYQSFEHFARAAHRINDGEKLDEVKLSVVSIDSQAAIFTTAILEAGRMSMQQGKAIDLTYDAASNKIAYA